MYLTYSYAAPKSFAETEDERFVTAPQIASLLSRNRRAWAKNLKKVVKKLEG